ncbi:MULTISPECIES: DUF397 domain-containing protein [unclassified Frankia]|uniref:DUF397 domain-containing protein n=1 Tax=unclassified Frankia TaxID=2632575 RepID=UPI001EF62BBE|nr:MULTISPECIES: DUF397 domain-containing protein [unclassified Frankia]
MSTGGKSDLNHLDRSGLEWRKSSYSNGAGGECVEIAPLSEGIAIRDSKDPDGAILTFTRAEWLAFLAGARGGEFDLS